MGQCYLGIRFLLGSSCIQGPNCRGTIVLNVELKKGGGISCTAPNSRFKLYHNRCFGRLSMDKYFPN